MKTEIGEIIPIQQFLEELRVVRKLSSHTLVAYSNDLSKLANFAIEHRLAIEKVEAHHARSWISQLHAKGSSPRTIARTLSAWRTFYEWLASSRRGSLEKIKSNPISDLRSPKRAKSLPKALSVEYALVLMEKAKSEAQNLNSSQMPNWISIRDHALVELLYSSGLRLSELLSIDLIKSTADAKQALAWIDWESAEVNVLGKGGKRRIVPVGTAAMSALNAWQTVRQQCISDAMEKKIQCSTALFLSEKFQRLSPRTVQLRLEKLANRAGIPTHVHPHMLRHSFASHVLQSSHDLRAVQEMLGHASIGSTQIYTSLDFQHLAQAYDAAHPRAKQTKT